jgi:natural resistance-associated macrophage protein
LKIYATTQAVGTIGAVIMPHNLYLHSSLVLSRKIERTSPDRVNQAIKYNLIESSLALLISFFINLGILAANANNFYSPTCAEHPQGPYACLSIAAFDASGDVGNGQGTPCVLPTGASGKCGQIGLDSEANALKYGLGHAATYTWAIGLLAAGQASTMTCTYAGQVIMGGCLDIQLAPWKRVAFTRALALGPSIAVAATTISDSGLYNDINEYLNVLQSVQLPFAMLPLLHFSAQKSLLGRFRSSPCFMFLNVCLALVVMSINMYLIYQFLEDKSLSYIVPVCIYGVLYFFVCMCMMWTDFARLVCVRKGRVDPVSDPRTTSSQQQDALL